jgi:hypothetical protein
MPRFVTLSRKVTGGQHAPVLINADQITYCSQDQNGTSVYFDKDNSVRVAETHEELMALIGR